jgi:TonB-linked SusC/RagA family outer membrane protein
MKKIIFFIVLLLLNVPLLAQVTIQGTVKSAQDNSPLPGVSILLKGTTTGTVTDLNGNYSISAPATGTLVFSYVGFQTQEIVIGTQRTIDIELKPMALGLNELVVVGYGTTKRKDLTGSVASVVGAQLSRVTAASPIANLQGQVSGVQIINNGQPGSAPQILIRGVGSIEAGTNPLYVVDGVITDDIRNLDPNNIQSIDVLKDASSEAIYGARGSNGVIMITTKSGSAGKMQVHYDGYFGLRTIVNNVKMASTELYENYTNAALVREGNAPAFSPLTLTYNTNWLKEITRVGNVNQHTVSISGGSSDINYFISLGYYGEKGVLLKNDYQRISLMVNNKYHVAKFLTIGNNLNFSSYSSNNPDNNAYNAAYRQGPNFPPQYGDGNWGWSNNINNVGNPVAELYYFNDKSKGYRFIGSLFGEAKIIPSLKFRSNFGLDIEQNRGIVYNPADSVSPNQMNAISNLSVSDNGLNHYTWDNYFTFDKSIEGIHNINVVLGVTSELYQSYYLTGYRQDVPPQENYWYLNLGNAATATNSNGGDKWTRLSYFARASYNFKAKYLFTGTLRREGSSRFSSQNRWGLFPSVGLGWRISDENFIKNVKFISNLKLRASWGLVGNDNIPTNAFLYTINTGLNYPFNQQINTGSSITDVKDPNLKWETSNSIDIGLDFGFFDDKLTGTVDYYNKQTKNMLYPLPLPAILGSTSYITNVAKMENKGIEAALNWSHSFSNELKITIGGNITLNTNKVLDVSSGSPINGGSLNNGQTTTRIAVGQPVGAFWVYKTAGIYKTQSQIDNSPHMSGAKVGDLIYVDTNHDGVINEKDRVYEGSYQPKAYFGFNISLQYKEFDFLVTGYGNLGNKIYNGKKAQRWGGENIEASLSNYWTENNSNSNIPAPSNNVPVASDYYLESGNFLRVNNITLGYTIPLQTKTITKLRVYLTAENPITIKAFSGYNPVLQGGDILSNGIELSPIPTTATYLLGVNLNF